MRDYLITVDDDATAHYLAEVRSLAEARQLVEAKYPGGKWRHFGSAAYRALESEYADGDRIVFVTCTTGTKDSVLARAVRWVA